MVDVNTDDVRAAGNELYPALAGIYGEAISRIGNDHRLNAVDTASDHTSEGAFALSAAFADYLDQALLYLDTSKSHLEVCGETLVAVADDHDWTDADNAHGIDDAWASSKAAEESKRDEQ